MEHYISDPGLQKAGEMLLEDLSVLEQMTHDLEILLEEAPRLYFFAQELEKLIEAEIKKKRKLLMEIVDAHVH